MGLSIFAKQHQINRSHAKLQELDFARLVKRKEATSRKRANDYLSSYTAMGTIPPILYKYLPPDRLSVLTSGALRISQRQAVNDPNDFRPPVQDVAPSHILERIFGDLAEKDDFPAEFRPQLIQYLISRFRPELLRETLGKIRTPDQLGMVCLTNDPSNERMWIEYAANCTGFVLGLDVRKFAGDHIARLKIQRVRYTKQPMRYLYDSVVDLSAFFQKHPKHSFECEWRGISRLDKFPVVGRDSQGLPVHLCSLPPKSVVSVHFLTTCTVKSELMLLMANDARYREVKMVEIRDE